MKPDERRFLLACFEAHERKDHNPKRSINDVINGECSDIPPKRCWYWLEKWTGKGWYDYGVAVDFGWFEPKGVEVCMAMLQA